MVNLFRNFPNSFFLVESCGDITLHSNSWYHRYNYPSLKCRSPRSIPNSVKSLAGSLELSTFTIVQSKPKRIPRPVRSTWVHPSIFRFAARFSFSYSEFQIIKKASFRALRHYHALPYGFLRGHTNWSNHESFHERYQQS